MKSRVSGAVVGDQKGARRFNFKTELSGNQDCSV